MKLFVSKKLPVSQVVVVVVVVVISATQKYLYDLLCGTWTLHKCYRAVTAIANDSYECCKHLISQQNVLHLGLNTYVKMGQTKKYWQTKTPAKKNKRHYGNI